MSIEGLKFCDGCGGAISPYDLAPVKMSEDGHTVQLHLHNRHAEDCLAQMLTSLAEQHANDLLAAISAQFPHEPVQHEA